MIQLLQNLIGNAILYRGERTPRIRVAAARRDKYWEFSVSDNGIGIAAEHYDQIFRSSNDFTDDMSIRARE